MHVLTIRPVQPEDLDAILQVQAACYPPAMQETAGVVLDRMRVARATCVLAEDEGGVCGYLFAYPSRMGRVTPLGDVFRPAPDADTLYLHDLALAPRAHGRGLARALVHHLLDQARQGGMAWSALVSVQDTARFWNALGFDAAGDHGPDARAALASYPGTAHYMTKQLTAPGAPSPNCSSLRP